MKEWNPRYLAYCDATGALGPEATMRRDRKAYPGGHMAGFILWISQEWGEWHAERGRVPFAQPLSTADHEDFDAWLRKRFSLCGVTAARAHGEDAGSLSGAGEPMRDFSKERLVADQWGDIWTDSGERLIGVEPRRDTDGNSTTGVEAVALAGLFAARWNAVADALEKLNEVTLTGAALEARIILREAILGKR